MSSHKVSSHIGASREWRASPLVVRRHRPKMDFLGVRTVGPSLAVVREGHRPEADISTLIRGMRLHLEADSTHRGEEASPGGNVEELYLASKRQLNPSRGRGFARRRLSRVILLASKQPPVAQVDFVLGECVCK